MATYSLRPTDDLKSGWNENPAGSAFDRLDDAINQPTAPSGTDWIDSANEQNITQVNLSTVTLGAGENVVAMKLWVWADTSLSTRSIDCSVNDGTTHFIDFQITGGNPAGWYDHHPTTFAGRAYLGWLTQAQIDGLRITLQPTTGTGSVRVDAVYVQLDTSTVYAKKANDQIRLSYSQPSGLSSSAGFFSGDIFVSVDLGSGISLFLMGDCEVATAANQQHPLGTLNPNNQGADHADFQTGPVLLMNSYDIESATFSTFSGPSSKQWAYFGHTIYNGLECVRFPLAGIVRAGRLFVVGYIEPLARTGEVARWVGWCDNWQTTLDLTAWTWNFAIVPRNGPVGMGDRGMIDQGDGYMYMFSSEGSGNLINSLYRITTTKFQTLDWYGGEWWNGAGWARDRPGILNPGTPPQRLGRSRARGHTYGYTVTTGAGGNFPSGSVTKRPLDGQWQMTAINSFPLAGVTPRPMGYSLVAPPAFPFPAPTTKYTIPDAEVFVYGGFYHPQLTWAGKGTDDQVWSYSCNGSSSLNPVDTSGFPRFVKALSVT